MNGRKNFWIWFGVVLFAMAPTSAFAQSTSSSARSTPLLFHLSRIPAFALPRAV